MSDEDTFNQFAWSGFISFALNDADCRGAFVEATGIRFDQPESIDKFVEWVTVNHYGLEHSPLSYQREIEARRKP